MTTRKKPTSRAAVKAAADGLGAVGQLRMLEELLSRSDFAQRAGITYAGARDLYTALGYKRILEPADYRSRYERSGIAQAIVASAPKATWRGGLEIVEDEDPEVETDFEEAWEELSDRLMVPQIFQRADILAGLGRFAIIIIGVPGDLSAELPKRLKPEDIKYLAPYGQEDVSVTKWETAAENERFGLPLEYTLRRHGTSVASGMLPPPMADKPIHWTRVIHIAEGILDERVFGTPRLQGVWNDLDDLDKVKGSGSEAFWQRVQQGIVFSIDSDKEISPTESARMKTEIDAYIHNMRRSIIARGTTVSTLGGDVSNFSNQLDAILTVISGSCGIPKRILMGSERGELASTQDRENWEQRISDRRSDFAEHQVVRPFIQRLIDYGALPEPDSYEVRWPEIESLTETEQAAIADQWSKLNGQAKGVVVTAAEIRDRVLRLEPLTPEQIGQEEETIVRATPAPLVPGAPAGVSTPVPTSTADATPAPAASDAATTEPPPEDKAAA